MANRALPTKGPNSNTSPLERKESYSNVVDLVPRCIHSIVNAIRSCRMPGVVHLVWGPSITYLQSQIAVRRRHSIGAIRCGICLRGPLPILRGESIRLLGEKPPSKPSFHRRDSLSSAYAFHSENTSPTIRTSACNVLTIFAHVFISAPTISLSFYSLHLRFLDS